MLPTRERREDHGLAGGEPVLLMLLSSAADHDHDRPIAPRNALTALPVTNWTCTIGRAEVIFPAWKATQQIPVQLVPVEMEAALALDHGIYAYDAYYLHCSLLHRRPLVTLDRKMRGVAKQLGIRLLV